MAWLEEEKVGGGVILKSVVLTKCTCVPCTLRTSHGREAEQEGRETG